MPRSLFKRILLLLLVVVLASPEALLAQYGGGYGRGGRFRGPRGMGGPPPGVVPPTQPDATAADKPKEEKKDDKPVEPKKDEGPAPIMRPLAPDNSASLAEQKMTTDAKRQINFNFQEAPWTFVVEELARVTGANLDWTQLPGDSLNLRSNKKYSVAEARDLINEHLMARGYAILFDSKNQNMTVVNLDTLNTALVPRVQPEDLDTLSPHDLVKVSFRLDWLMAKDAVEEFKQVLSPKAKLLPLKTTNRLEAIDSAINLKQLYNLLEEEQGRNSLDRLAHEFDLRYTRAPEVVDQLELFLGLKKPGQQGQDASGGNSIQQMMMQRMAMMGGQQAQPGQPQPATPQVPEIHLMANTRRNTVIVNAPPDKMGIIKAAIWKIDVPSSRENLSENTQLMQVYHLATLDPETAVAFLESVGDLDPQTKLDVDKKNKTVIAFASAKDHKVIAAMVKNLDGSDRSLKVIQLRKLEADMVAGTLRLTMVGDDKDKNNNSNSGYGGRRYGGWFGGFGMQNQTEETNTSKFRVEADVVDNRLIVWANSIELELVNRCLAELGEIPRRDRGNETVRVLDVGGGDDDQVLLDRLRRLWPAMGKNGNKLIIDLPKKKKLEEPAQEESKPEQGVQKPAGTPSASNTDGKLPNNSTTAAEQPTAGTAAPVVRLADFKRQLAAVDDKSLADAGDKTSTPVANDAAKNSKAVAGAADKTTKPNSSLPAGSDVPPVMNRHHRLLDKLRDVQTPPQAPEKNAKPDEPSTAGDPIVITRGADGKLVISSRDTQALDMLEDMLGHIAPPKKDYAVYYLKHADSYSVKLNLEEFFQTDKKENSNDRMRRFWWDDDSSNKTDDSPKLSRRKPLRFIDDSSTNSVLVQGGTPDQLRQIDELINMYDNPKQANARPSRVTQIFYIKNNKASVIAEVIKDTYRDLLSTKDKALESYNQTKAQGKSGGRGYISYDFGEHDDDGKLSNSRFSGSVSMGVDDTTNSLVVSCATPNLMLNIQGVIKELDKAAIPAAQSFTVLQINRSLDAAALTKKLGDMLKKPTAPQQGAGQQPGQNQPQQQQGRRGGRGGGGGGGFGGGGNDAD
jgi:type II secretory pathway component GspD/PulD (secretin)